VTATLTADDRKKFALVYKANFARLPFDNDEEAAVWFDFLDTIPAVRIEALFNAVIMARGGARYRPGLEDFKKAWTGGSDVAPSAYCLHCDHGRLLVMAYLDGDRWVLCDELVPGHEPTVPKRAGLGRWYVPCHCKAGRLIANDRNGDRAIRAVDWVVAKKCEWGIQDSYAVDGIYEYERWARAVDARYRELYKASPPQQLIVIENTDFNFGQQEVEVQRIGEIHA
jgi:hypothetical protein